jgi:alcohol dehydrogenase class IV
MVYHNTQLIKNLSDLLHEESAHHIFFVHGKHSYVASGAAAALNPLLQNFEVTEFTDFTSNPKYEDALKGVETLKQAKADCVIGVGGGSCMDMAKLIRHFYVNDPDNDCDYLPLVVIATTAGTGAEETQFAVCYRDGVKTSVSHPSMLPDRGIICPEFTYHNSQYLTAQTGFDALAQAIEAFWNVNANEGSDEVAELAIRDLLANLPNLVHNLNNHGLRDIVAEGANYAGMAINITRTTAPHAISYTMTSHYGYPHGHAVALTFPYFAQLNISCPEKYYQGRDYPRYSGKMEWLIGHINGFYDLGMNVNESNLYEYFKKYTKEIGLGYDPANRPIDYETVAKGINIERAKNNPHILNEDVILKAAKSITD